jgi:flagellar protein FlaG
MSIDVTPIGPTSFDAAPDSAVRRSPAARDAVTISSGDVPDGPPPEVLEAMHAAARCAEQLHEQGRELRFGRDPDGGRVTIDVCDLDGNLLRAIPPSRLLDVATGAPLD